MGMFAPKNIFPCNNCPEDKPILYFAEKTLTRSQILNLGTAKELIAAPGPGLAIQVLSMSHYYQFVSTPYTTTYSWHAGPTSLLTTNPYDGIQFMLDYVDSLSNTSNQFVTYRPYTPGSTAAAKSNIVENEAFSIWSQGLNPTGGNGVFTFYMTYILISI